MQGQVVKSVDLNAPLQRVWQALSDAREFGQWFRAELSGEIRSGAVLHCPCTDPGLSTPPGR